MMMNKKTLSVAVLATLGGLAASQANAAVATYASELPAANVLPAGTFTPSMTSYSPTSANPLYLTFSLTSGTTFASSPALGCTDTAGASYSGAVNISLAAGGVGNSAATFVVSGTNAGKMLASCTITNGNVGVAGWPTSVSQNVSAVYGNNLAAATTSNTALLASQSMLNNAATAATTQATVASGYISFNAVTTALVGNFTLGTNATLVDGGGAANTQNLSTYLTGITVSLAGSPLAAAQVTGGVVLVAGATCGGTKVVSANAASTITFSAFAAPAAASQQYSVCMTVTGATIPAGTITVGVTGGPAVDAAATPATALYQISTLITSGTTVGTITHDGASTTVLNLPPSTNTDAGYLRIYNTSSMAGNVTAQVYNEAGTALTAAGGCSLGSLAAGATMTTSAAALETTCGITPPATGRYKVVLNGAFTSMRAQGLVRSGGVLINMSADTSSAGN